MQSVIQKIEEKFKKPQVVDVMPGDTVKVHQKIKEGSKERIQIFQGLVIRVDRKNTHTSRILVRRIASGIGVEKSFLLHSPLVEKVEIVRRSKVRRNYLSFLRNRSGKGARLTAQNFDREGVNTVAEAPVEEAPVAEEPTEEVAKEEKAE